MHINRLGLFDITLRSDLISYICYNWYMLWKSVLGDMEYGEAQ